MKKFLFALVVLSLFASVAAAESALDTILKAGEIRIGVGLSGAPMGGRDASNNPIGYDPDIAALIGEALGVKVDFVEVNGQTRIPMLMSDKVDIILCNMTGNLERAKSVTFTAPYIRTGIKLLVRKGSDVTSIEQLAGKKAAVGRGTTNEALVKAAAPTAEMVYTDEFQNQLLLLRQGKVDGALEDSSLIDFAASQYPDEVTALPRLYTSDPICIAVKRGDAEFLRWLDMFVSTFISSGKQNELYKKWWGTESTAVYVTPW